MEDLLNIQGQLAAAIEKLFINFKKDGAERKTPQNIKRRLETLEQYWRDFQGNHVKLCEYDNKEFVYFAENHYERVSGIYNEALTALKQFVPANLEEKPVLKPATPIFNLNMDWNAQQRPATPSTSAGSVLPERQRQPSCPQTVERGSESKLEDMYRKQQSNFKAFQRAINNTNLEALSERWELEDALKTIQIRWAVIDQLHWEIDSEQINEKPEYEATYNKCEQKYNDIKKHINSKIWASSHREKSTPTLEIPTFNGNYHQWISFKDLFTESIHNNNSISKAQKMQFLKSKVKGEAEKLIQHLNISSENYQVCWEILNHRYNNTKLIFSSHINILLGIPVMQQQSALHIKKLHDTTKECLHAIENLGVNISTWDPLLVHLLTQKLDADSHNDYIEHLIDPRELPTLSDFLNFLETKFTALESSRRKQEVAKHTQYNHEKKFSFPRTSSYQKPQYDYKYNENRNYQEAPKKSYQAFPNKNYQANFKCSYCNFDHELFRCHKFLRMTPETRIATITSNKICPNCLYKHYGNPCKSEKRCKQCNAEHNTILHEAFVGKNKGATNEQSSTKYSSHVSQNDLMETLLSTAQIKVKSAHGTYIKLRALIDQGSQISLITESAAQRLGLPRKSQKASVFGIGTKASSCKGVINITASSIYNEYTFDTKVFIMNRLMHNIPNRSFTKPTWSHLEGLQLADPQFNISQNIDILLGADIYSRIIMDSIIRTNESTPIAQQTRLGWILCGNMKSYHCNLIMQNLEDISRFWKIEDIEDTTDDISTEDQYCINQFKSETKRRQDGRYVVRLPLKPNIEEKLGESRQKAVAQFYQLEKKFIKDKKMAQDYKAFINEYIELGHMHECKRNTTPNNFLPHHCVQRAESTTTALRVVYNASSPTSSGHSLNDLMYSGPNLQADLLSLILKWRQYKIAFTADIEKMFRQILCHEQDQLYQKIIWRDHPNQPLREYALATVTYGTKAAPFLAMMTLKQLAIDEGHRYPDAAKILEQDFYMDDLLSGSYSVESATKIQSDLINLLKMGGFNLRKWSSNNIELSENSNITNNMQSFEFKHQESKKTLGLRWNPKEDVFKFQLKIEPLTSKPTTKRSLLSEISKVFDPLGWLCPTTTKLKLIFQEVWKRDLTWDDQIPENIENEWRKIKQSLNELDNIEIPRWLQTCEGDSIELHAFTDGSMNAYACVIYSKVQKKDKSSKITIVAAKSKLVPAKKAVSLPRIELLGALLLSKLMKQVLQSLSNHNIKLFCWTDSTAVLGWLQGDITRWKTFVANRVAKINEIIPSDCWRYVKSAENPADPASRGISAKQLKEDNLWWQGPAWLPTYQAKSEETMYTTEQDIKLPKQTNVTLTTSHQCYDVIGDIIKKYSNINRMTRVLAWVLRAISRERPTVSYITVREMRRARNMIIRHVQRESFPEEISSITKHGVVKSKSSIISLNPFLDQDGLLRVNGRIRNANIDPNMKHPLIIPHKGHITDLLIENAHIMTHHGGARLTLRQLKYQYWIIGGNRAVKKHINHCIKCIRHKTIKQDQLMGDLPSARCNPTRPFYHTGVDYIGFIEVKSNKGRGVKTTKGYIAVFVCMVTKAVHLELVSDLSSSAFLAALRRLSARRGTPRHMYSDNGTNFVGASKRLKQDFIDLQGTLDVEFFTTLSEMEIEWHFNAPSWPSAGGIWEAAVKSLKHHLRRVIGEQKLTYEEYSTLLAQLEACLNARPLCAITEDPEDLDFLTPAHFLASGPNLTIYETEKDERTRWQLVQKILADTWKRWQSEYLCQLSRRCKWQQPRENMKIGDIVIIHDTNLPTGKWALGRVIDVHPGRDGYVRVVSIKTKNSVMKRPITKLSKLPINQETASKTESKTEAAKPEANIKRNKRSCNFITLALMLLFTLISPAQSEHSVTTINKHQGVYFDKLSNMHLVRDEWKLIVYYDMEPYWQGQILFQKYLGSLEKMCTKTERQNQCDVVLIQLRHGFAELEYYNSMMLGQQIARSARRRRRGLINGIGSIANSLFGILDDHFAEQYERDIKLIRDNQKHLALLWKNQTSVIEAEYNLLKRVEEAMDKQHKIINQHIITLEQSNVVLAKEVAKIEHTSEFMLKSIIANAILANLKTIQETLLETITDVHHGKFNIHLLTPAQLKDELNIISGQLSKELTIPINNIQTDLQSIYHLLKVKTKMTAQYLIFEIRIPLASRDTFEIYKLIAVPRQVKEKMISILPISEHVAINIQKDSFIPLSETQVDSCMQQDENSQLCPLQKPIYHMNADDSLCIKDEKSTECKTINAPCTDKWTQLKRSNTYLFFCCGHRTIRIICESQVTGEQISGAGIITLGDGCVIKGEAFTIFAHKQQTNNINMKPDFLKIEVPSINNIINLSIPIHEDDQLSHFSNFKKQFLEIGRQVEQMKDTETRGILADRITSHDVHQFVVLYILLGAAIVCVIIYAWRRLRIRCPAQQIPAPPSDPTAGITIQYTNREESRPIDADNSTSPSRFHLSSARVLDKATSPIVGSRLVARE